MNRIFRSLVAGSVIGATVGLVMLMNRRRVAMNSGRLNRKARGTIRVVRDNTTKWTSALKNGTEAFSRRLTRRTS